MEIRTTKDIFNRTIPWQGVALTWEQSREIDRRASLHNKRWVVVEDVLKLLDDDSITDFQDLIDNLKEELKKGK